MINKKAFIFNTLTEALKYKISADPRNTTYRWGSFAPDAEIKEGGPDIPYYSEILIRETNQIWRCNQFWLNDVHRDPTTDLTTERAERIAGDEINRQLMSELEERHTEQMQELSDKVNRNICALEFYGLPVFKGPYVDGTWYKEKHRVTHMGSEFQAKQEGYLREPVTVAEDGQTAVFNTEQWYIVSNGTDAFLINQQIQKVYITTETRWAEPT